MIFRITSRLITKFLSLISVGLILSTAYNLSQPLDLKFLYSEVNFNSACSYFEIIKKTEFSEINDLRLAGNFTYFGRRYRNGIYERYGKLKEGRWEFLTERFRRIKKINRIPYTIEISERCFDNFTNSFYECKRNITKFNVSYSYEFKQELKYLPIKYLRYIRKPITKVRFCGKFKREFVRERGWSIELDFIPKIRNKEFRNYVWWNTSYAYRRNISCTNMNDRVPFVINGSNGFCGGEEIVWTYCSGTGTALYYNTLCGASADYVVANDTTQLPMDVSIGNSVSFNPSQVYENFSGVWHFDEGSGSQYSDSALSNNAILRNQAGWLSGKIYQAGNFDGVDDYANFTDDGSLIDGFSKTFTVFAWINKSSTNSYQAILSTRDNPSPGSSGSARNWDFMGDNGRTTYYGKPSVFTDRGDGLGWCGWIANTAVPAGQWYFIAFVYDSISNKVKWYMGNSTDFWLDRTASSSDAPWNNCASVVEFNTGFSRNQEIAKTQQDGYEVGNYFAGEIDELFAINQTLSADFLNQSWRNHLNYAGYGDLSSVVDNFINSPPRVIAVSLNPTSPYTYDSVDFHITVVDNESSVISKCEYFIYNSTDLKFYGNYSSVSNNTDTIIFTLSAENQSKNENWNFTTRCYDGFFWSSTAYNSTNVTIRNSIPTATRIGPTNNEKLNSTSVMLHANATDPDADTIYYYWFIDSSQIDKTTDNYTTQILSEGLHSWQLKVGDEEANGSISSAWNFYVDITPPTIFLYEPINNSKFNSSIIEFNFSVIENIDSSVDCNLTIDSVITNSSVVSNNTETIFYKELSDGSHFWNITCEDLTGNQNTSETYFFEIDTTPPQIVLTSPLNSSHYWDRTVDVNFSVENSTCFVSINGGSNISLGTGTSFSGDSFYPYPLDSGTNNITVSCVNEVALSNSTTSIFFINQIYLDGNGIQPGQNSCFSLNFSEGGGADNSHYLKLPCSSFNVSLALNVSGSKANKLIFLRKINSTWDRSIFNITNSGSNTSHLVGADISNGEEINLLVAFDTSDFVVYEDWKDLKITLTYDWESLYGTGCSGNYLQAGVLGEAWDTDATWTLRTASSSWTTPGGTLMMGIGSNYATAGAGNSGRGEMDFSEELYRNISNGQAFYGIRFIWDEDGTCPSNFTITNIFLNVTYTSYPQNASITAPFSYFSSSGFNVSNFSQVGSLIEDNLSLSPDQDCSIYFNVSADSLGDLRICAIENHSFMTQTFPGDVGLSGGIPYFYFFPKHRSEKNVSAWKQTSNIGVLNVTNNRSSIGDLVMKINKSIDRIDLKCANSSSVADSLNLTTSYQKLFSNFSINLNQMFWCWADYYNPPSLPALYELIVDFWSWD